MKIKQITFEDGSEQVFKEIPLEEFNKNSCFPSSYYYRNQHKTWEEDYILPNLQTDLKDWAMDQYHLINEADKNEIEDFDDIILLNECRTRNLSLSQIGNESIINENFIERIIEISRRGDDNHIDAVLETLEKLYRIK